MTKKIMLLLALTSYLYACKENAGQKKTVSESNFYQEVSKNENGDTNFVRIKHSGLIFLIHYLNNKPQGLLIQDMNLADTLRPHYIEDNKGVFLSLNPETHLIDFIGYKYFRKDEGGDIKIDSTGQAEGFSSWRKYNNEGKYYDVKHIENGIIKVYVFEEGETVDTLVFLQSKKSDTVFYFLPGNISPQPLCASCGQENVLN